MRYELAGRKTRRVNIDDQMMRRECTMDKKKQRRARRAFTAAFKAEAVRLRRVGDRSVTQVADDLDLTETALRDWVKRLKMHTSQLPSLPCISAVG
jgi:transposase-like protein